MCHLFPREIERPRCFCACVKTAAGFRFEGALVLEAMSPVKAPGTLALGFKGDSAPALDEAGCIGTILLGTVTSPVTRLRIGGRPVGVDLPFSKSLIFSSGKPRIGDESFPKACLLDFSCFAWTDRKWRRSSCHLISSRLIFDRVPRGLIELQTNKSMR